MRRKITGRIAAGWIAVTMCIGLLTACQSSSQQGTSGGAADSASSVPAKAAEKSYEEAVASVEAVTGSPAFYAEDFGEIDIKSIMSGKKVSVIAYDATNDWCINYAKMTEAIYKAAGAETEITYCENSADSWIQAIQSAVNQKADAISFLGISDASLVSSVIDEAKAAGVYVQIGHGSDLSDTSSNADVSVGCDYKRSGVLCAEKVIESIGSTEDVNCLVLADVGYGADPAITEGVKETFDAYGCKYNMAEVSITDWTEGIGNAVRNAFVADPSINAVISYYDNMCIYAVSALEELGISKDDVVVGSFNGSPNMLEYVQDKRMDFDLGESTAWIVCHDLDCMARYFSGQEVYSDAGYAMYFITGENIEDYLDPSTGKPSYAYDGVQDIYLSGYSKLWGVDLTGVLDGIE